MLCGVSWELSLFLVALEELVGIGADSSSTLTEFVRKPDGAGFAPGKVLWPPLSLAVYQSCPSPQHVWLCLRNTGLWCHGYFSLSVSFVT